MISVVIVAHNEAEKLARCLRSVAKWANEIVVVDLESHDHIAEVVAQFGAKHIRHPFVTHVEQVRNFALSHCRGPWILVLDPDEQVTPKLKKYLTAFARKHPFGVLNIPRKNIFWGQWIRHTNFWPDYQIRFFSIQSVNWKNALHSYPHSTLPIRYVPAHESFALQHIGYTSVPDFFERQNRYSTVRAQERFHAGERFSFFSLIYWPCREFLQRFIWHRGFLDGKRGLFLVLGLMFYHFSGEWKLWQHEQDEQQ